MDIQQEQWLWNVAVKKIVVGVLGLLATKQAVVGLSWLHAHGIAVNFDVTSIQSSLEAAGFGAFVAVHDWLKLKTGWAWL